MARETKEQRQLRWAAEEAAALVAKQNYRQTMPEKLAQLRKLAPEVGVNVRIDLTGFGPVVEFTRWDPNNRSNNFEETLTYDSEQWQVESVEQQLIAFGDEIRERQRRKGVAENAWSKLSAEEQASIKEFINAF